MQNGTHFLSAKFPFAMQHLWLPVCFPAHQISSEKGSTLKGTNLLSTGSKFFPFRVTSFQYGYKNSFDKIYLPLKAN